MIATPVAARFVRTVGAAPAVVVGAACVVVGSLPMLTYRPDTPLIVVAAAGALLGAGLGFANLGYRRPLPGRARGRWARPAACFRRAATSAPSSPAVIMGAAFADAVDGTGLHVIAAVTAALAALTIAVRRRTWSKPDRISRF